MAQLAKLVMQLGLFLMIGSVLAVLTGEGPWWYLLVGAGVMGICAALSYMLSGGKDLPS